MDLPIQILLIVSSAIAGIIAKSYTDQSVTNLEQSSQLREISARLDRLELVERAVDKRVSSIEGFLQKKSDFHAR